MKVNYYGTAENKAATGRAVGLIVLSKGNSYSSSELLQLQGYIYGLGVIPGYSSVILVTPYTVGGGTRYSARTSKLLEDSGTYCVFEYSRPVTSTAMAATLNTNGRNRLRTIRQTVKKLRHFA